MATKKIYLNPGDLLKIHIIEDPDLPKTHSEWASHKPRPKTIYATLSRQGITFHDPAQEIFMQMGKEEPRRIN